MRVREAAAMRKLFTAAAFISVLLLLTVAATQFVNLAQANPYIRDWKMEGTVPPPDGTNPPVVSIFSPANHTSYPTTNFLLNFTATIEKSNNISLSLSELYYITSWQKDRTNVDFLSQIVKNNYTWPSKFSINMTNVPEGPHWLEVHAAATGFAHESRHEIKGIYYTTYYVGYKITSSSTVEFTIDTTAPSILTISAENKTYATSDVPLTCTVNESATQITYSLDGQENVTIPVGQATYNVDGLKNFMTIGKTTLTNLANGEHSLTVYATDEAGNTGASETVYFNVEVPEPFPTTLAFASGASVATVGIGLLVVFKKRKSWCL